MTSAYSQMINEICKTLFFHHILISRFSYVENLLHYLADFPVNFIKQFVSSFFWCLCQILLSKFLSYHCLHYILYQEYCISYKEMFIFYADKLTVMCNSQNSHVFNFAILLKSWKSRNLMFYSTR